MRIQEVRGKASHFSNAWHLEKTMHEQHYKELIFPSELPIYYDCQKTTIEHIGSMRNSTAPLPIQSSTLWVPSWEVP